MPPSLNLDRAARFTWRALLVGVGVVVVALVLARLRLLVLPIIIALLITTILLPLVDRLIRWRVPRAAAVLLVLVGAVGGIVAVGFLLAPSVASEFTDLGPTLEEGVAEVEDYLATGPFGTDGAELEDYLSRLGDELSGRSGQIVSGAVAGAIVAAEVVAGLLLVLVFLFFILKDGERFTSFGLRQVRPEHHELAEALARRAWHAAGGYVRGTAFVALVDAVLIGVGLLIIGVPLVLPLAILTFVGGFFPLVGATAAGVVAALVALVDGGLRNALLVVGVIVIVQQVEGNVLQPLVLGRAVKLHPVVVLSALTAGAVLGGLIGAFLAVPVAAVAVALGTELRARGIIGPGAPDPHLHDAPDSVTEADVEGGDGAVPVGGSRSEVSGPVR